MHRFTIIAMAALIAAPAAAQTRMSELVLYDEEGEKLTYSRLDRQERAMLNATVNELAWTSQGGEPAGCVAGSGMVYCWAFGYICYAVASPFVNVECAACYVPSNCE